MNEVDIWKLVFVYYQSSPEEINVITTCMKLIVTADSDQGRIALLILTFVWIVKSIARSPAQAIWVCFLANTH